VSEILSGAAFEYLVLDYADAAHKCAQHWASAEDDALKAHLGSRLRAHDAALRAENERLRRLLSEVAEGGVEFADERVRYVAVQIDRETWAEVLALAKGDDRGRPA